MKKLCTGIIFVALMVTSLYAARREDVDLTVWRVNGTQITPTAAELNRLDDDNLDDTGTGLMRVAKGHYDFTAASALSAESMGVTLPYGAILQNAAFRFSTASSTTGTVSFGVNGTADILALADSSGLGTVATNATLVDFGDPSSWLVVGDTNLTDLALTVTTVGGVTNGVVDVWIQYVE